MKAVLASISLNILTPEGFKHWARSALLSGQHTAGALSSQYVHSSSEHSCWSQPCVSTQFLRSKGAVVTAPGEGTPVGRGRTWSLMLVMPHGVPRISTHAELPQFSQAAMPPLALRVYQTICSVYDTLRCLCIILRSLCFIFAYH